MILAELPKEAEPLPILDLATLGGIGVGLEVIEPIVHQDLSPHKQLLGVRRHRHIGAGHRGLMVATEDGHQGINDGRRLVGHCDGG